MVGRILMFRWSFGALISEVPVLSGVNCLQCLGRFQGLRSRMAINVTTRFASVGHDATLITMITWRLLCSSFFGSIL